MNLNSLTSLVAPLMSLVLAVSLWGCGATPTALSGKMEVGEAKGDAQPLLAEAEKLWAERGDRANAEQAIQKWEAATKLDPTRFEIPLKLSYGYYFMAHVHDR